MQRSPNAMLMSIVEASYNAEAERTNVASFALLVLRMLKV